MGVVLFIIDSIRKDRGVSSSTFLSIFGGLLILLPFIIFLIITSFKLNGEYLLLLIVYSPFSVFTGLAFLIIGIVLGMIRIFKKEVATISKVENIENAVTSTGISVQAPHRKINIPMTIFLVVFFMFLLLLFRSWVYNIF